MAVLGSFLALSGTSPARYSLTVPLTAAVGVLLAAAGVSWWGTRDESGRSRARRSPAAGTRSGGEARRAALEEAVAQMR